MTQVNKEKVETYAMISLLHHECNPLEAIGMLTMQMTLHKRNECDCGKSVEFLQETIDFIAEMVLDEGDES